MLTEFQQEILDNFLEAVVNQTNLIYDSSDRGIGKTYILNELGFNLQALGYKVLILTPFRGQEYFADRFISNDSLDFRGISNDTVIIGDEARFFMMADIVDYCRYRKIPIVGYFNLTPSILHGRSLMTKEFEKEYSSEWIK